MKANRNALINEVIFPWIALGDDDELSTAYLDINSNDEAAVVAAIRADIIPHLLSMPCQRWAEIDEALEYAQTLPEEQLERIWESVLPPFPLPDIPALLFKWIREELAQNMPQSS